MQVPADKFFERVKEKLGNKEKTGENLLDAVQAAIRPEDLRGVECYLTEDQAKKKTCKPGEKLFLFVKQGEWADGGQPTLENKRLIDKATGQVDTNSISNANEKYNKV